MHDSYQSQHAGKERYPTEEVKSVAMFSVKKVCLQKCSGEKSFPNRFGTRAFFGIQAGWYLIPWPWKTWSENAIWTHNNAHGILKLNILFVIVFARSNCELLEKIFSAFQLQWYLKQTDLRILYKVLKGRAASWFYVLLCVVYVFKNSQSILVPVTISWKSFCLQMIILKEIVGLVYSKILSFEIWKLHC